MLQGKGQLCWVANRKGERLVDMKWVRSERAETPELRARSWGPGPGARCPGPGPGARGSGLGTRGPGPRPGARARGLGWEVQLGQ